MKKSKLSKSLVAGFIAAMSLSACSPVKASSNAVVTFTDANGNKINVISETMYNDALKDQSQVSTLYEKLLEVFIRNYFERGEASILPGVTVTTKLETIKAKAQTNVDEEKEKAAKDSAGYETAWENILESNGVDDEEGLKQKFIYEIEKDVLTKAFNKANKTELAQQFLGVSKDVDGKAIRYSEKNNVQKTDGLPYHISHILIKTQDDAHAYTRDKISKEVAEKLSNVVLQLATGNMTFNQVAAKYSDDTSNKEFGDVGIVSNTASTDGSLSMVSEFQLGLYAFDNIFARTYGENDAKVGDKKVGIVDGLGLESTTRDGTTKAVDAYKAIGAGSGKEEERGSLLEVPYDVFVKLGEVKDKESVDTASDDKTQIKLSTNESLYPRNVLWNKYLNHHDVFVITNRDTKKYTGEFKKADLEAYILAQAAKPEEVADTWTTDVSKLGGFKAASAAITANLDNVTGSDARKVLYSETGDEGQVIFGVRSNYGIHLLTIEKSINDFAIDGGDTTKDVSLAEYYTTETPTTGTFNEKYPYYKVGDEKVYKETYVNSVDNGTASNFETRAETVENKISSFDSTTEYMLYEQLFNSYGGSEKLTFTKDIDKLINNYIDGKREVAYNSQEENLADAWSNYVELLQAQYESRSLSKETKNKAFGLIPLGCIEAFDYTYKEIKTAGIDELFKEGGVCYYA